MPVGVALRLMLSAIVWFLLGIVAVAIVLGALFPDFMDPPRGDRLVALAESDPARWRRVLRAGVRDFRDIRRRGDPFVSAEISILEASGVASWFKVSKAVALAWIRAEPAIFGGQ